MNVIVLSTNDLKDELLEQGISPLVKIDWINNPEEFLQFPGGDAYMDLVYDASEARIALYKKLPTKPIIINSVVSTLKGLPGNIVRINGWPTFLRRTIVEAACYDEEIKSITEKIFASLNKEVSWTPDIPGFVTARVIAMIINEAYYALEENVSSRDEIDIAMKLGTNYPFGPFEWNKLAGPRNIAELLKELSNIQSRYQPASLLLKEING